MSMKRILSGLGIVLLGALLASPEAPAQRLAGARALDSRHRLISVQSANPAPRAPSARSNRSWMPVLGSLAAGGLLGALLGENILFGILMAGLLIAVGVFVARLILRARDAGAPAVQFAALGSETVAAPPPSQAAGLNGAVVAARPGPELPEDFDLADFLRDAKLGFVRLRVANELGRLHEIRQFATPEMYAALAQGAAGSGDKHPSTDVVSLNAELTALATQGDTQRASVRFSGLAREALGTAPTGFAEIWHLVRPADGAARWLIAGIQRVD